MGTAGYRVVLFGTAAAAYVLLSVLLLLSRRPSRIGTTFIMACIGTAGAALTMAIGWGSGLGAGGGIAELGTSGTWCLFASHLWRKQFAGQPRTVWLISVASIGICLLILGSSLFPLTVFGQAAPTASIELYLCLSLSVLGALLTENVYRNTSNDGRWNIKLLCIALAMIFFYGIAVYSDALLFHRLSPFLADGRAIVLLVAAPLFAVSAARNRDWAIDIHVSRTFVFHTATLIGSGIFLLALALTGQVLRELGPSWGHVAELTLLIGGITGLAVVLVSGSARSRLRWLIAENFYSYRYDYRQEWMKISELLAAHPEHAVLQTRVIRAVAQIVDSPGGVLWVRDLDGAAFQWAGSWNQPAVAVPEAADAPFVRRFADCQSIFEIQDLESRPDWLRQLPDAWLALPLSQENQLIGFIVLAQSRAPVRLDSETLDLLRIVAGQAAIHVAEQRYARALSDAQALGDYGKRFAFVVHDVKNVTSQLNMILRNARFHAGDPKFQEDVLGTVQSALGRMNDLLGKLRPGPIVPNEGFSFPTEIIGEVVSRIRRSRGIDIRIEDNGFSAAVAMKRNALSSVITHLCENAIEASDGRVQIHVHQDSLRARIDVIDNGMGMAPEFIRDELFRPFGSTKQSGFGIGAYQARELVRAAGGDLLVFSRPGSGTTMRLVLPCVPSRSEQGRPVSARAVAK